MGYKFIGIMACTLAVTLQVSAQTRQLKKIWETDQVLKVPESVLYYKTENVLYFSCIDGTPLEKDGQGYIGKMGTDGKIISQDWVKGLNAPKGMGIFKDMLYVTDIDEVVAIDVKTGAIVLRVPVPGAKFLNDISINSKGVVYVSDYQRGTVHTIENGKLGDYLNNVDGVNGLYIGGDELYLIAKGNLWKARSSSELVKIAEGMDESSDGIEMTKEKDFVVSSWAGVIYYVKSTGKVQQLLDTRTQKSNTADIGFDAERGIVYVPTFFHNTIAAYELK